MIKDVYSGFYGLTETQRIEMVMNEDVLLIQPRLPNRKPRKHEKERFKKEIAFPEQYLAHYFPVWLDNASASLNYGRAQGLIFITAIMQFRGKDWWRVGVSSPDDLDMDLDFEDVGVRDKVLAYMKTMNRIGVSYNGVLTTIQSLFGGTRSS